MDVYLLSLFSADLLHALGDIVSLKWVNEGNVRIGGVCTAQGILIVLGANSIATSTLAITVHTFSVIWFRKGTSSGSLAMFIILAIWTYIIILNIVWIATHKNLSDVYAPTPSWCGIANPRLGYMIAGEYLWLWLALVISFLAYIPLSFLAQGRITLSEQKWWKFQINKNSSLTYARQRLFYTMIVYPVVYSIIVLPFSIVRWYELTHGISNLVSQLSTKALWGLSGVLDVSVFLLTRPNVLLFDDQPGSYGQPSARSSIQLDCKPEGANQGTMTRHERMHPDLVEGLLPRNVEHRT